MYRKVDFRVVDAETEARLRKIQRFLGALDDLELFTRAAALAGILCDHAGTSSVVTVRNAAGAEIKIDLRG